MCRGEPDGMCMCPWIASLPRNVRLPLFHYSEADLEACQDPDMIREALSIRQSAQAVCEVLSSFLTLHACKKAPALAMQHAFLLCCEFEKSSESELSFVQDSLSAVLQRQPIETAMCPCPEPRVGLLRIAE